VFLNLFFLIIVILLIGFSRDLAIGTWPLQPLEAFIAAIAAYGIILAVIVLQNRYFNSRRRNKTLRIVICNSELLVYLAFFFFVLGGSRFFSAIPFSGTFLAIVSLSLYFGGLYLFHYTSFVKKRLYPEAAITSPGMHANSQIRMWLPFTLPFILISIVLDLLEFSGLSWLGVDQNIGPNDPYILILSLLGTGLFLLLMLVFMPYFIQRFWQCKRLGNTPLHQTLELFCQRVNFKHAGMRTWTVMNHALTAAIIGIVPNIRYVMFTERLLKELPETSIEAILAHEIGHSKRYHLLLLPYVMLGMLLILALFSFFFAFPTYQMFNLLEYTRPSPLWNYLYPFAIIIPYIIMIGLYFRLIFGYFSRLFERQADLYPVESAIPAETMIQALDDIGIASGMIHDCPSWHHYSIRQRMNFLLEASINPKKMTIHHRKTALSLLAYSLFAALSIAILLSPFFDKTPPFTMITSWKNRLDNALLSSLEDQSVKHFITIHPQLSNKPQIKDALLLGFKAHSQFPVEGIAPYIAAEQLYKEGAYSQSLELALLAAKTLDWSMLTEEGRRDILIFFSALEAKLPQDTRLKSLKKIIQLKGDAHASDLT